MTTTAKWCTNCRQHQPVDALGVDSSRGDGLTPSCRDSRNARARAAYTPKPGPRKYGPDPHPARDGDREQARQRVNVEVSGGRRPHPNSLACTDCGHVWSEGERRHEYDHHHGYGAEHHLYVEPVCTTCHARRERDRGLFVRTRDERGRYVAHGG